MPHPQQVPQNAHIGAQQDQRKDEEYKSYFSFPAPLFHTGGKPRALDSRTYPEYSPDQPRNPSSAHRSHARWHPNSPEAFPELAEIVYCDGRELPIYSIYGALSRSDTQQPIARPWDRGFSSGPSTPDISLESSRRLASRLVYPDPKHHRRSSTRPHLASPVLHQSPSPPREGEGDRQEEKTPHSNLRGGLAKRVHLKLADDERVPKFIWYTAGGMGRSPTGKGVKDWKRRADAQKAKENADVEARLAARKNKETRKGKAQDVDNEGKREARAGGGFWRNLFRGREGKKLKKQRNEGETKEETKVDTEAEGNESGASSDAPEAVEEEDKGE